MLSHTAAHVHISKHIQYNHAILPTTSHRHTCIEQHFQYHTPMPLCKECEGLDAYQLTRRLLPSGFKNGRFDVVAIRHLRKHHQSVAELYECAFARPTTCKLCRFFIWEWAEDKMVRGSAPNPESSRITDVREWVEQTLVNGTEKGILYTGPSIGSKDSPDGKPIARGVTMWLNRPGQKDVGDRDKIGTVYFFFKRGELSCTNHINL